MYLVAVVIMYCLCLQALVVVNSHGSLTVSNIRRFLMVLCCHCCHGIV